MNIAQIKRKRKKNSLRGYFFGFLSLSSREQEGFIQVDTPKWGSIHRCNINHTDRKITNQAIDFISSSFENILNI